MSERMSSTVRTIIATDVTGIITYTHAYDTCVTDSGMSTLRNVALAPHHTITARNARISTSTASDSASRRPGGSRSVKYAMLTWLRDEIPALVPRNTT